MADHKAEKVVFDWVELGLLWALQLWYLSSINSARWVLSLFLSLTPTLWAPRESLIFMVLSMVESPVYLSDSTLEAWMSDDAASRCKTRAEKISWISTSVNNVSGWYSPGTYLAWLITAYVAAASSIWHSKCARRSKESEGVDGEILLALAYPMIAVFDIIVRLIRCQIDPGMTAAVFVVVSSLTILGPASRLSWQHDGDDNDDIDISYLPSGTRQWAWKSVRFICHTIIYCLIGEPYLNVNMMIAIYIMLFLVMLYAEIRGTGLSDKYPYRRLVYRPRLERIIVFGIVQAIFAVVLLSLHHPLWPQTGANLWDLDQAAGLLITVSTLVYSRSEKIKYLLSKLRRRSERHTQPSS